MHHYWGYDLLTMVDVVLHQNLVLCRTNSGQCLAPMVGKLAPTKAMEPVGVGVSPLVSMVFHQYWVWSCTIGVQACTSQCGAANVVVGFGALQLVGVVKHQ